MFGLSFLGCRGLASTWHHKVMLSTGALTCAVFCLQGFGNYCKVGAGPCTGDWNVRLRTDIIGNDLDCNAKDFKVRESDRTPYLFCAFSVWS